MKFKDFILFYFPESKLKKLKIKSLKERRELYDN